MTDFDCGCGFDENDPICKCNGGPGYENLGGGGSYKKSGNVKPASKEGGTNLAAIIFGIIALTFLLAIPGVGAVVAVILFFVGYFYLIYG